MKAVQKKQKVKMEFPMRSSPKILYGFLSTPSRLSEWFADDVTIREGVYTFHWDGEEQSAKMTHKRENQMVRFKWLDDSDDAFIEFEITTDELTSDVSLMVSDFATEDDIEETQRLWDTQIHNLRHLIGS